LENNRIKGNHVYKKVKIGDNSWIGAWVAVAPGVTIGELSEIGNHSYVLTDVPSNSFAIGIPARFDFIYEEKLKKQSEEYKRDQKEILL
jgi:acetyltransferase-like isoleucine patch superfamily enzyme